MKHVIGIDFGTSTSMIKVAVRDDSNSLETKEVKFTQYGIGSTPTLIRKKDGGVVWYGQDAAQNERMDTVLYRNFKLDLKSDDAAKRQEAIALLEEFYRFLYKTYAEQKAFLLDADATEVETVVSYPAQWGQEQQEAVINAARKAGFPNVSGMDEPTAAVICVLKAKQKELEKGGLLRADKPLNILIVDMGAGTTDLAFVTATVENGTLKTGIRQTWPEADSGRIYGGSQMDLRLEAIMESWLTSSGLGEAMAQNLIKGQRSNIKSWKESTLSPLLEKGMHVDEFSAISNMLMMMGISVNPFPAISRETFADHFHPELESFVNVIASAPQELRDETELVVLTGGNSAWYWVPDVMLGKNTQFGDVGLKNIPNNPSCLIRMEQPADTVSRGLVYDKTHFKLVEVTEENTTNEKGNVKNAEGEFSFFVQYKNDIGGQDLSVFGVVNSGRIHSGDIVEWENAQGTKWARVLQISGSGQQLNSAKADMYVRLILENTSVSDIAPQTFIYKKGQRTPLNGEERVEIDENKGTNSESCASLGHDYVWKQVGKFQIPTCSRCGAVGEAVYDKKGEAVYDKKNEETEISKLIANGKCGSDASWDLYQSGELKITGSGKINDYSYRSLFSMKFNSPWYDFRDQITTINVGEGIICVGTFAFADIDNAVIYLPSSLKEIRSKAFTHVREVHFSGPKPVFGKHAFCQFNSVKADGYYLSYTSGWSELPLPYMDQISWHAIYDEDQDAPEEDFIISSKGTGCGIKKYIGNAEFVKIPSTIRGHRVVSIDDTAFGSRKNGGIGASMVKRVIIPDGVTSIEGYAFAGCSQLEKVIMGQSVQSIGDYAFEGCLRLQIVSFGAGDNENGVVKFPKTLNSIGVLAFPCGAQTLKEVWLSKATKQRTSFGFYKTFTPKNCALYYYEDQR